MSIPKWGTGGVGPEIEQLSPWDTLVLGGITLPGRATVRAHRGRKHDRKRALGADGETFTDQGAEAAELDLTITIWRPEQMDDLVQALDRLLPAPRKTTPAAAVPGLTFTESGLLNPDGSPAGAYDPLAFAASFRTPGTGNFDIAIPADQEGPYPTALFSNGVINFPTNADQKSGASLRPLSISHPSLARLKVRSVLIIDEDNFRPGPERGTYEWHAKAVEWMSTGKAKVVATPSGSESGGGGLVLGQVAVSPSLPIDPSQTDVGP